MSGRPVRIGIVGGGLMGRELAAAIGRWTALQDHPAAPVLTAVCDPSEPAREWFRRVATVTTITDDRRRLLDDEVDQSFESLLRPLYSRGGALIPAEFLQRRPDHLPDRR